ncbi:MAG: hypothetical protein GY865_04655, partial [candidate division Zixibacteria bacterium]|nr:hypothetical protein [candidate division Zixibacteria bacterium]
MKKLIILISMFLMFLCQSLMAIDLESSQIELNIESLKSGSIDYLESAEFLAQEEALDFEENDKSIYEYTYKSPKKAFLYSLIIPGWGQRYAESSILKTVGFLLIEAGSWGGYFSNHNKGNDKTTEYQAYANIHWTEGDTTGADYTDPENPIYSNLDPDTYRGWLLSTYGSVNEHEIDVTGITESLPSTKTQQYYEMIGKYPQFVGGWDDYVVDSNTTAHSVYYMGQRKIANDYLDNANTMMVVSMLNHLISAFDAALSANRHNKKIDDDTWSVKAVVKQYSATEKIPMIKITHS